jgi:hypothetical protein
VKTNFGLAEGSRLSTMQIQERLSSEFDRRLRKDDAGDEPV